MVSFHASKMCETTTGFYHKVKRKALILHSLRNLDEIG